MSNISDLEPVITNSTIGESTQCYKLSKVVNSNIGNKCVIGDLSRIMDSKTGDYVRIDRSNLVYHSTINDFTYTGSSTIIMHATVGKFSSIAWSVSIGPGNHDYKRITSHDFLYNDFYGIRPINEPLPYDRYKGECIVGNDVWIGANVTIVRGVKIGDGAVIGANSVVTRDIPPYAIAVGSPAKILKFRFTDNVISELLELKWWDLPIDKIKDNYKLFESGDVVGTIEKLKSI